MTTILEMQEKIDNLEKKNSALKATLDGAVKTVGKYREALAGVRIDLSRSNPSPQRIENALSIVVRVLHGDVEKHKKMEQAENGEKR